MSATTMALPPAAKAAKAGGGRAWLVAAAVAVAALLSGFYGVNEYAAGTGALITSANRNAGRFDATFRELVAARYRTLGIAADTMLQSRVTVSAFANDDRAGLAAIIEPFFQRLQRDHAIEQLNFWLPPARSYYRAGAPSEAGTDLSNFRRSIVAANERRTRIMTVETGLGGVVALRAIVPVIHETRFIGALEFVSSFEIPLERARATTGLNWAYSITREVNQRTERPPQPRTDVWQGDDLYVGFSDPATTQLVRDIRFDPRQTDYTLARANGRTVFVKAVPVVNFSGQPTITIAAILDLTDDFAAVLRSVAIKCAVLFLVIAVAGSVAAIKFKEIRATMAGVIGRQTRELAERAAAGEAAAAKLRDVDLIKRGFFNNLVTAVNEPLQAVAGSLSAVGRQADPEVAQKLQFPVAEMHRLSRLVEDFHQIELFRQKLVKTDAPLVPLAELVGKVLAEDTVIYSRLAQLRITAQTAAALPPARADATLLRRAITNLVGYAAQRSGQGDIVITASQDAERWLVLSISGSAFAGEPAPNEALFDEARQFLNRLADGGTGDAAPGLVGVVLARIIVEFFGGTLVPAAPATPGFHIRLPAAA